MRLLEGQGGVGVQKFDRELFEEFKRVDAICRDMFSSQRGVSEYIEQMERDFTYGKQRIPSWERDYRSLKRVRWLRNQIAHEMTATDCTADDVEYLKNFHDRILRQKDPLAVLRRTRGAVRPTAHRKQATPRRRPPYSNQEPAGMGEGLFWGVVVIGILIALGAFLFLK